jgi:hypothetical protein
MDTGIQDMDTGYGYRIRDTGIRGYGIRGYGFASFVNFCLRKPSWSLRSSVKRTNPGSAGRLEVWGSAVSRILYPDRLKPHRN